MKASEIIKQIETMAPLHFAESWDKSGMQVAAYRKDISHIAIMLDPLPQSIATALNIGADFILAHHPLRMQPCFADKLDDYHEVLALLFKADVALYSAHTSLDCNPAGPVRWLAKSLELTDLQLLETTGQSILPGYENEGSQSFGLGFVGSLPAPLKYEDFCKQLVAQTGKSAWRSSGPRPVWVSRVACCPGSGSELAPVAKSMGADVFITGDVKYHTALNFEINVIDIGHFLLEEIMMQKTAEILEHKLNGIKVSFIPGADPFVFEQN
ncbi:Nif3-like dinuclear metal center hexameric protein [Desulfovibrio sp. OttesenSCG-928-F07]|nr:Nif3-like dinuclear metal center hexameric protein [Desulfovibrio sp. OttesenSCG-928-F07]